MEICRSESAACTETKRPCSFVWADQDPQLVPKQKRPMYACVCVCVCACVCVYVCVCVCRKCGSARGSSLWQHRIRSRWPAAQCCHRSHSDKYLLLEGIVCVLGAVVGWIEQGVVVGWTKRGVVVGWTKRGQYGSDCLCSHTYRYMFNYTLFAVNRMPRALLRVLRKEHKIAHTHTYVCVYVCIYTQDAERQHE